MGEKEMGSGESPLSLSLLPFSQGVCCSTWCRAAMPPRKPPAPALLHPDSGCGCPEGGHPTVRAAGGYQARRVVPKCNNAPGLGERNLKPDFVLVKAYP